MDDDRVLPFTSMMTPEQLLRAEKQRADRAEHHLEAMRKGLEKQAAVISATIWKLGGMVTLTLDELMHPGYQVASSQDQATGAVTWTVIGGPDRPAEPAA